MTGLRAAGGRSGLLAAAALVAAGILLTGVPAAAHPGDTTIQISPAEAEAGSTLTVSGEGFTAGGQVDLLLITGEGDQRLTEQAVDDEGHFVAEVLLDGSLDTRYYEVQAVGSEEAASQLVAVSAAAGTADDLPSVGPGPVSLLLGGAALLLVGALVAVAVARRRTPVRTAKG